MNLRDCRSCSSRTQLKLEKERYNGFWNGVFSKEGDLSYEEWGLFLWNGVLPMRNGVFSKEVDLSYEEWGLFQGRRSFLRGMGSFPLERGLAWGHIRSNALHEGTVNHHECISIGSIYMYFPYMKCTHTHIHAHTHSRNTHSYTPKFETLTQTHTYTHTHSWNTHTHTHSHTHIQ